MANKTIGCLIAVLLSTQCFADPCKFSTDITPQGDKFLYTKSCHILVGKDLDELDLRRDQVNKLQLSLKATTDAEALEKQRAADWMTTSLKLEDSFHKKQELSKYEDAFWFFMGAAVIYGASRIPH
jgi:hypothetical protein